MLRLDARMLNSAPTWHGIFKLEPAQRRREGICLRFASRWESPRYHEVIS